MGEGGRVVLCVCMCVRLGVNEEGKAAIFNRLGGWGTFSLGKGSRIPIFIIPQRMIRSESCSRGICMCDDLSEPHISPMEKHIGGCKDRAKECESGDKVEKV